MKNDIYIFINAVEAAKISLRPGAQQIRNKNRELNRYLDSMARGNGTWAETVNVGRVSLSMSLIYSYQLILAAQHGGIPSINLVRSWEESLTEKGVRRGETSINKNCDETLEQLHYGFRNNGC